jgi:hypothetical protein
MRKKAFVIRPAMHNGVAHLADDGLLNPLSPVRADDACNPAHSVYALIAASGSLFELRWNP